MKDCSALPLTVRQRQTLLWTIIGALFVWALMALVLILVPIVQKEFALIRAELLALPLAAIAAVGLRRLQRAWLDSDFFGRDQA